MKPRPDDVPEDIWQAAEALEAFVPNLILSEEGKTQVARALLAERLKERAACAAIADAAAVKVAASVPEGLARAVWDGLDRAAEQRAQSIAQAIRSRP